MVVAFNLEHSIVIGLKSIYGSQVSNALVQYEVGTVSELLRIHWNLEIRNFNLKTPQIIKIFILSGPT